MKRGFTIVEIIVSICLILMISLITIISVNHNKDERTKIIISDVKNSANLYSKEDLEDEDYDIKGFSIIEIETLYESGFIKEQDYNYIKELEENYHKVLLQKENDGFNKIYYPYQSPAYYISFDEQVVYRGDSISSIEDNYKVYNEFGEVQSKDSISNLKCDYTSILGNETNATFISNTIDLDKYEINCTYQSEFNEEKLDRETKRVIEVKNEPVFTIKFLKNDIYNGESFSKCLANDYEVYNEDKQKVVVSLTDATCNYQSVQDNNGNANQVGERDIECNYSFNYNGRELKGIATRKLNIKSSSVTYPNITYYVDGVNVSLKYSNWYKNMTLKINKGSNEETFVNNVKINGDYNITSSGIYNLTIKNKLTTPCGNTFESTSSANFRIDNTSPTVSQTTTSETIFYENIEFTLTDNDSGLYQYAYSKNSTCSDVRKWTSMSRTSETVTNQYRYNGDNYICVRDNAGNQTNKKIVISGLKGIDISYSCVNSSSTKLATCVQLRTTSTLKTYITSQKLLDTSNSYIIDYGVKRKLNNYTIDSNGYYVYTVYLSSKSHGTGYNYYYVNYYLYDIDGNYTELNDSTKGNNFVG